MFTTVAETATTLKDSNDYYHSTDTELRPTTALVFYESTGQYSQTVIVRHNVKNNQLDKGEIIDATALCDQLATVNTAQSKSETLFIRENILVNNSTTLVFYEPFNNEFPIWMAYKGKPTSYHITIPAMLYVVSKQEKNLTVFALASDKRPTLDTDLYAAPFPNVYESGVVCQGTARIPSDLEPWNTKAISHSFLYAKKTHLNNTAIFKNISTSNTTYSRFLKEKQRTGQSINVAEELQKRQSLKTLLDTL